MNEISELTIREFSQVHNHLYRELLNSLNACQSWRELLTALGSYKVFIASDQIRNMETALNPSAILLQELQTRCARVKHLQHILRTSGLLNALSLISDPEQIKIIKQPGDDDERIRFEVDSTVSLECLAESLPPPMYQWYRGNIALKGQTMPTLTLVNFREEECDEYYCTVHHTVNGEKRELKSNSVILELMPLAPKFTIDLPPVVTAKVSDDVRLHVEVIARPQATYTWVLGNTVLEDETTNTLYLKQVQEADQGNYHCLVRNEAGEVVSKMCDLIINDIPTTPYDNIASAKVALLIANSVYDTIGHLKTPSNDVAVIAHEMAKLGFRVIVLQNLTLVEMKNAINWFCQILPADAYAFFYFVGHGFQLNNKYMMPVDCPDYESFNVSDCYSDEMLIEKVIDTDAQLLVTILDMCLKVPLRENLYNKEPITKYKRKKEFTLIQNFSTSSHMEAYEKKNENLGVYAKHLIKFLSDDSPIFSVLQSTIEEFAKCEECNQRPSLTLTLDDPLRKKFTDPVSGDEMLDRELCMLYELPEEVELFFRRLGINPRVKLSFYKHCFVNSLVFVFPIELNAFYISAEVHQEDLSNYQWTESESGEKILTLFDLQKAKTSISIIIQLNKKRANDNKLQFLDWCELDLSCIGIVEKRLWFNKMIPE